MKKQAAIALEKFLSRLVVGQQVLIRPAQGEEWVEVVTSVSDLQIGCGKYHYSRKTGLRVEPGNAVIGTPRLVPVTASRLRQGRKRHFVAWIAEHVGDLSRLNLRTLEMVYRHLNKKVKQGA